MSENKMSYDEAVGHYTEWAGQVGGLPEQPCEAASEVIDMSEEGMSSFWALANIRGPLAIVEPDGTVDLSDSLWQEICEESA